MPVIAAVAVAVAVLAVIAAIVVIAGDDDEGGDTGETSDQSGGIEFDDSPVTSPDGLELSGLNPDVRNDPPLVGDTLTLSYTLTNTTDEPVEFAYTYVGARNPDDDNRDPEDMNEEAVLAPGETLEAQGRVLLDSAGTWLVWPCYELSRRGGLPRRVAGHLVPGRVARRSGAPSAPVASGVTTFRRGSGAMGPAASIGRSTCRQLMSTAPATRERKRVGWDGSSSPPS